MTNTPFDGKWQRAVLCRFCKTPTIMLGTGLCDPLLGDSQGHRQLELGAAAEILVAGVKLQYVPGQEVVVPRYGVGRVMLTPDHFRLRVKTYADEVEREFDPANVKPWPEVQSWQCGCGHTNGVNLAQCAACTRRPNGQHP